MNSIVFFFHWTQGEIGLAHPFILCVFHLTLNGYGYSIEQNHFCIEVSDSGLTLIANAETYSGIEILLRLLAISYIACVFISCLRNEKKPT